MVDLTSNLLVNLEVMEIKKVTNNIPLLLSPSCVLSHSAVYANIMLEVFIKKIDGDFSPLMEEKRYAKPVDIKYVNKITNCR